MPQILKRMDGNYSNLAAPGSRAFNSWEYTYTTTGAQEWIVLPDTGVAGVVVSFPSAGTAYVEATDSPKEMIMGIVSGTPEPYQWPNGTVSATTNTIIQGANAVRLNVVSGTAVKLMVTV